MVNKYIINKNMTLKEWLETNHLGKTYINKLNELKAISNINKVLLLTDFLKRNDEIYINFSLLEDNHLVDTLEAINQNINIIYEDENIIAIDKESGILVHSDGNTNNTLLNYVVKYLQDNNDDSFIRPLHRIDVETSGVVIFVKNILAYDYLTYQMENKLIQKEYLAVVKGLILKEGTIELNIGRDRHNSKKYIGFVKDPINAITKYYPLKQYDNKTLLRVNILTGKPHQIRVSMAFYKHPIIGDKLYNDKVNGNQKMMLLSNRIRFDLFGNNCEIKSKMDIMKL